MASRECIEGKTNQLLSSEGYISSYETQDDKCGGTKSPWRIEALSGQQVNITLIDFSVAEDDMEITMNVRTSDDCTKPLG